MSRRKSNTYFDESSSEEDDDDLGSSSEEEESSEEDGSDDSDDSDSSVEDYGEEDNEGSYDEDEDYNEEDEDYDPMEDALDALIDSVVDYDDPNECWDFVRQWLREHSVEETKEAVGLKGEFDTTALHVACRNRPPVDVVEIMLMAAPDMIFWADSFGWLPVSDFRVHIMCASNVFCILCCHFVREIIHLIVAPMPLNPTCIYYLFGGNTYLNAIISQLCSCIMHVQMGQKLK